MEPNIKRHKTMFEDFLKRSPYNEDDVTDYVPLHSYGIRINLRDGSQVDYDSQSEFYRYRDQRQVSGRSSLDITDDTCREIIAENLENCMRIRGIGQKELSERTGLSQASISKYLNKQSTPTATALKKLALALGCHYSELLE